MYEYVWVRFKFILVHLWLGLLGADIWRLSLQFSPK
jgi:hypothetical protein